MSSNDKISVIWTNIPKYFSEYENTAKILHIYFEKDPIYILKFLTFAKKAQIKLDPLLDGLEKSKKFTAAQTGYDGLQRNKIIILMHKLIATQFNNIKPIANPTYYGCIGATDHNKIDMLSQQFSANNKVIISNDFIMKKIIEHVTVDKFSSYKNLKEQDDYLLWQDARDFIANFMLCLSVIEGLNIVHDCKFTNNELGNFLNAVNHSITSDNKPKYNTVGALLLCNHKANLDQLQNTYDIYVGLVNDVYDQFKKLEIYVEHDSQNLIKIAESGYLTKQISYLQGCDVYLPPLRQMLIAAHNAGMSTEILEKALNMIYAWDNTKYKSKIKYKLN